MTKKKLLDDMLENPPRFYRSPGDILRDRRLADADRVQILCAWCESGSEGAEQAGQLMMELQQRLIAHDHAAE